MAGWTLEWVRESICEYRELGFFAGEADVDALAKDIYQVGMETHATPEIPPHYVLDALILSGDYPRARAGYVELEEGDRAIQYTVEDLAEISRGAFRPRSIAVRRIDVPDPKRQNIIEIALELEDGREATLQIPNLGRLWNPSIPYLVAALNKFLGSPYRAELIGSQDSPCVMVFLTRRERKLVERIRGPVVWDPQLPAKW